jgi:outer membrane lipoprotein SlyB
MSFLDSLFNKPKESDTSAADAARADALRQSGINTKQFVAGGAPVYDQGQQYYFNELGQLEQLGPSEMQNIQTDPRLMQAQYDALRELETRGREGFTARDELDRLKTKQQVGKENAGRLGAIQQNMAARGMGGSGMDLVAQLQASQAATDREALAGLERNAAQEQNRANSSAQAGGLAGNIRGQGFQENSAKAQAQDAINRFNTTNSVNRSMYNNRGMNDINAKNVDRYNQTMDRNTEGQYGFRKDAFGANQGQQQMNYNAGTEDLNAIRIKDQQARDAKKGTMGAIGTIGGGIVGGIYGGPAGAAAGASVGGSIGGAFAHGGMIPGQEVYPWDDTANDTVQIQASPGEIVIPKSIANDPIASAQFVDRENRRQMASARQNQDYMGLGNVLGKAATDYGNSQNQGVVLANRMQDLGQKPSMYQTEKKQFDSSILDSMGKMGVDRAQADASQNERSFNRNIELKKLSEENKFKAGMRDPNSQESIAAREYLKNIMPSSSSIQGFDNLSAEQVGRIAPGYQNLKEMNQKSAQYKAQNDLEKQKLYSQDANTKAQLELRSAMDKRDQEQTSVKRAFDNLPEDSKRTITSLSTKNADKEAIASQIEAVMGNWDNLSDREKLQQGNQLVKTLNSTQGADAVGTEEAKRLAGKLEFTLGNFFNGNPTQFGRDLEGFKSDADLTVKAIRDSMNSNQKVIDKAYGRPTQADPKSGKSSGSTGSWEDY